MYREEKGWGRQDQRAILWPNPSHLREEWDIQVARHRQDQVSIIKYFCTPKDLVSLSRFSLSNFPYQIHWLNILILGTLSQMIFLPTTSTTSSERESSSQRLDRSTSSLMADTSWRVTLLWVRSTSRERTPMDSFTSLTLMRPLSVLNSEEEV